MRVIQEIDKLNYREWTFYIDGHNFWLDNYYEYTKENPRKRNFTTVKKYERLSGRNSNLKLDEVELPEWVKEEVVKQFVDKIEVKKWRK
jgi:hypothetical protein